MEADLQRILATGYLDGIGDRSIADLRSARVECRTVETKLSYLRRLVQGHHDVVGAERSRRSEGGERGDLASLIDRLPAILADRVRAPGAGRLTPNVEPGDVSGALADRVRTVVDRVPVDELTSAPTEQLAAFSDDLADLEGELSAIRRSLFDRIDTIEAELTRRYRDGEANVDELLAGREAAD